MITIYIVGPLILKTLLIFGLIDWNYKEIKYNQNLRTIVYFRLFLCFYNWLFVNY